ncbi:MAG: 6,7-dimethyl-8-ribityllumazine synthase [Caulobacteraceae bacterium]
MPDLPLRVLIVEARFYDGLADELLKGASDVLSAFGAGFGVVSVPGALEIPAAIAMAEAGAAPFDGYVTLGCAIRGETWHFEIVANESARGLMDLAIGRGLAIGNGILTVEDEAQAWARGGGREGEKGGGGARACLEMIAVKRRLAGNAPEEGS